MSQFIPPSKEEIKKRYGIANDDFKILVSETTPTPEELAKDGAMLEPVASCFGVPTFLLKNLKGVLLALIFVPWWGPKVIETFRDCVVVTTSYYSEVLTKEHAPLAPPGFGENIPRYVITVPNHTDIVRNVIDLKSGQFPEGTGIFPYHGKAGPENT